MTDKTEDTTEILDPKQISPADLAKALSDDDDGHVDPDAPEEAPPQDFFEALAGWRGAKSLLKLKEQVNARFPGRRKQSDGMIGDVRHCGGGSPTTSDHCPWVRDGNIGVVTAFDITHDPPSGCSAASLVAAIHSSRDARVKYIIWNGKIANSSAVGGHQPWAWRPYRGRNRHDHHAHISVKSTKTGPSGYDTMTAWVIESPQA